ncbi:MAG: hypothetical protein FWD05_12110, partial [Oscillospiraceae bacterium]|nr:hypothetical protein [Oscillospiraceae bacterium]
CVAANVSMASELSHFMINYSKGMITRKDALDFSTRRKRRAIVKRIISELEQLKDAEEDLIDNAPENLREAPVYTLTDHFISILDDAINLLQEMVP